MPRNMGIIIPFFCGTEMRADSIEEAKKSCDLRNLSSDQSSKIAWNALKHEMKSVLSLNTTFFRLQLI